MHSLIINANELNQLIQNKEQTEEILLLDLSDRDTYEHGTIPSAVYLDYATIVSGTPPFAHKLPAANKFSESLAAVGYKSSMHIVAFDDEFGLKAARLYWTLRMAGIENFSLLNGGVNAWVESGYTKVSVAPDSVSVAASEPLNLSWNSPYLATAEQIKSCLGNKDVFLWDARSYGEWSGEECYADRAGRIPGALHLEWKAFIDEKGRILAKEQLESILHNFLGDNQKEVITYCQAHRRSSMTFLIASYLGVSVKGYDGSWMEWGNTPSLPLESGHD